MFLEGTSLDGGIDGGSGFGSREGEAVADDIAKGGLFALTAEGFEEVGKGGFGHCVLGGEGIAVLGEEFLAFGIAEPLEEARVKGLIREPKREGLAQTDGLDGREGARDAFEDDGSRLEVLE